MSGSFYARQVDSRKCSISPGRVIWPRPQCEPGNSQNNRRSADDGVFGPRQSRSMTGDTKCGFSPTDANYDRTRRGGRQIVGQRVLYNCDNCVEFRHNLPCGAFVILRISGTQVGEVCNPILLRDMDTQR